MSRYNLPLKTTEAVMVACTDGEVCIVKKKKEKKKVDVCLLGADHYQIVGGVTKL